jgi:hypothetical protein
MKTVMLKLKNVGIKSRFNVVEKKNSEEAEQQRPHNMDHREKYVLKMRRNQ